MAFDINEFKGVLSSRQGTLAKNKFLFVFAAPLNLAHPLWQRQLLQKDLSFYCESVNVPGRNVNTSTHRRYGVGWTESNVIYGSINQIQATFIADAEGEILSLFDAWIHYIIGSETWVLNDPDMFAVPYRDDIITNADIHIYRDDGKISKTYELYEVYPVAILDHQLSWADDNQIMTFTVVFNVFAVRSFEYGPNAVPLQKFSGASVSTGLLPTPVPTTPVPVPSKSDAKPSSVGIEKGDPIPLTPGSVGGIIAGGYAKNYPARKTDPLKYSTPPLSYNSPKGPSSPKG